MWSENRVSPSPREGLNMTDVESSYNNDVSKNAVTSSPRKGGQRIFVEEAEKPELRRRRKRSFEPGTEEYAAYVEKRVFNKRHAWTPFLWERKRDKQLLGNLNPTRGWKGWKHRQKMRWNSIKLTWKDLIASLEVWRHSLKRIEGHQGTGVVSYFVFLRFLFFLNLFICLTTFICIVAFQVFLDPLPFSKETTGYDVTSDHPGVSLAHNCTERYVVNSTSGFQLFLDIIQGTGWMEKTAFFYGYYGNTELSLPGNEYNMPVAYLVTTTVVLVTSLIVMVHYAFSKSLDTLLASDISTDGNRSFRMLFCLWDYRVNEEQATMLQNKQFFLTIKADLEEQRHHERMMNHSTCRKCGLWTLRVFINVFIVALLVASAAAIYYAQTFSSSFLKSDNIGNYHMLVVLMVEYLTPAIIAVFNALYPILFMVIVKLEQYTPSVQLKITIIRIVFVRLAALIVVTLTIYQEITCSTQDECYIGTGDCPAIMCWETYFGQQIYKFMVTEFAVELLLVIGYELPRMLVTTKCDCSLFKKIGPAEFDIAISVLDLVFAQALCWLGFFFCPLLPAMLVIRLFILFYLKKLSALFTTVPPDRPYQAARSNAFFMITLLVTYFLVAIPVGFVLVQLRPSPMCGPFRIYDAPTDIVTIQTDIASQTFQTFWIIVTSSAFITAIILILLLALYYCSALRSANNKMIVTLKSQLLQDEKDKQYLILQLSKYTGKEAAGNTSKPETARGAPPQYESPQPKAGNSNLNSQNERPTYNAVPQPRSDFDDIQPDYGVNQGRRNNQASSFSQANRIDETNLPANNQFSTTAIGGTTLQDVEASEW